MNNEIIMIVSVAFLYLTVLLFYRLFGKSGLYCWTAIATIAANIEVLILVEAFGMEQTLGNILFASTFLTTDILSELEDKKSASKAVKIGIATSVTFIIISQTWMLYIPSENDIATVAIKQVFSNTPRLMIAGIVVYAIVQTFDVWAYHMIWECTTKLCNDSKKFLWLRNNAATLISQFLNTLLFTFAAFWGVYEFDVLMSIIGSSYIIFICTSLLDTPIIYLARKLGKNNNA